MILAIINRISVVFGKGCRLAGTAVFLLLVVPLHASTVTVTSLTFTAVSNAIAIASPGDVIQLPVGTNVWTQGITLNGVSFIGAGTNATVIVDEAPRSNNGIPLITIRSVTNHLTELSQFTIRGGVTNTSYNYNGEIQAFGDSPASWRIDHLKFDAPYAKAIIYWGEPYAVIDHCTFLMRAEGVIGYDDGYGDVSWATPPNYGGSNEVYIEDCYFTNVVGYPAGVFDGYSGARVAFRHNVVLNDFFANHGTESTQRYRSTRYVEVYANNFAYNINGNSFTWAIQLRGGSGVIFSNAATGYYNLAGLFNYRNTDPFNPWAGATGNNAWDSNDPSLYLTGTHGGASGSTTLVVNGANWTANQWVGYTVTDTNSGRFSIIIANTANSITVHTPKDLSPMTFNTGDYFQIYRCIFAIDQVGRGSGDLIQGDGPPWGTMANQATGAMNWPHEVSEPLYSWANTVNGTAMGAESDFPNIQSGRDYINGTPRPNYTPFVYPHPLTGIVNTNSTGGGSNTNSTSGGSNTNSTSGGTTNTTTWPSPPTGLKVLSHTP